nr:transposase [Jannaschia seosinensis]
MEDKKRRYFPDAFKRQAAERVETSGLSVVDVAAKLGVHETQVHRWIRQGGGGLCAAPPHAGAEPVPGRLGGGECPAKAGAAKGPDGARHLEKSRAHLRSGHPLSAIAWQSPAGNG